MIQIHPLTALDRTRFHELASGYTSLAKYDIKKRETDQETLISLKLERLEQEYVKRWDVSQDDDALYEKMIVQGLSAGAFEGDNLVGIAIAEKRDWNRTFWIWEFHIDEVYRRRGIGRQLMEHMVTVGKKVDCRAIVCETQNTNVPAIQFYRKLGFEIGAVDLSYYTNKDLTDFEVAIFMKRLIE